jgi:hypothetical protein
MATNINTILNWFMTGKKPTQAQFWASWGSFWHKDETIPQSSILGLTTILNAKTENDQFNAHKTDANSHADLFASKENKNQKGVAGGYVPLNEFIQIASQYLQITDDLITGGRTSLLSAEQGKILQIQIDGINTLLTSNDVNLDTVQELVNAIKTVQISLSTILVNDLTTGGTTKALTAEMGKQLDLIKESTANKSASIVTDYLSNIKFPSVKAVYDFCMSAFKKKFLVFGDVFGITHTFEAGSENTMFKFSNNNPISATIPTNSTTPFEIGTVFETIAIGNGALTVTGAPGVTILTNLSNTSVKNEVRRYTKIDTDTWSVEGNNGKIQGTGVVYVSSSGNDATGEVGNILKPYATLTESITVLFASSIATEIRIISAGTFTTSVSIAGINKSLLIYSDYANTINFNSLGEGIGFNRLGFIMPRSTLNFSPVSTKPFQNAFLYIRAANMSVNTFSRLVEGGFDIDITGTLTVNNSFLFAGLHSFDSKLNVKRLKFIGIGGFLQSYSGYKLQAFLDINIAEIEHDNTFNLNLDLLYIAKVNITIGNIFGTYSGAYFNFISATGVTGNVSLRYNDSLISTKCGILADGNSNWSVSGKVTSTVAECLVSRKGSTSSSFTFDGLIASCNSIIGKQTLAWPFGFFGSGVVFNNCVINTTLFFNFETGGNGQTYPAISAIFRGVNYIKTSLPNDSDPNEYRASQTNLPTLSIEGILYTNAKFDTTKINIIRQYLNQYNTTNIIP